MYTEMPKRSTRTRLPAPATAPERTIAIPTLVNRIPKRAIKAAPTPDGGTRHSRSHTSPAHKPSAAKIRDGCGPESPRGIGSGGNNSAEAKNKATHRAGFRRVHQADGMRMAGAASTALAVSDGAIATAAAQPPNTIAKHAG